MSHLTDLLSVKHSLTLCSFQDAPKVIGSRSEVRVKSGEVLLNRSLQENHHVQEAAVSHSEDDASSEKIKELLLRNDEQVNLTATATEVNSQTDFEEEEKTDENELINEVHDAADQCIEEVESGEDNSFEKVQEAEELLKLGEKMTDDKLSQFMTQGGDLLDISGDAQNFVETFTSANDVDVLTKLSQSVHSAGPFKKPAVPKKKVVITSNKTSNKTQVVPDVSTPKSVTYEEEKKGDSASVQGSIEDNWRPQLNPKTKEDFLLMIEALKAQLDKHEFNEEGSSSRVLKTSSRAPLFVDGANDTSSVQSDSSVVQVSSDDEEVVNKKQVRKKTKGKSTVRGLQQKIAATKKRATKAKAKGTKRSREGTIKSDNIGTGSGEEIIAGNVQDYETIDKEAIAPNDFSSMLGGFKEFDNGVNKSSTPMHEPISLGESSMAPAAKRRRKLTVTLKKINTDDDTKWTATRQATSSESSTRDSTSTSSSSDDVEMNSTYRRSYAKRALPKIFGNDDDDAQRKPAPKRRRTAKDSSELDYPEFSDEFDSNWRAFNNHSTDASLTGCEPVEFEDDDTSRTATTMDASARVGSSNLMWSSTISAEEEDEEHEIEVEIDADDEATFGATEPDSNLLFEPQEEIDITSEESLYRERTSIEGNNVDFDSSMC